MLVRFLRVCIEVMVAKRGSCVVFNNEARGVCGTSFSLVLAYSGI